MKYLFIFTLGFPGGSEGKESAYNTGDLGSIPGSRRSPGVGNSNPLQYSCLENLMDRGAWQASPWGHKESDTPEWLTLSLFTFNTTLHGETLQCFHGARTCLPKKVTIRDLGLTPGLGRSPGEHSNPLQYSCLGNPTDTGAWQTPVHGITKE